MTAAATAAVLESGTTAFPGKSVEPQLSPIFYALFNLLLSPLILSFFL